MTRSERPVWRGIILVLAGTMVSVAVPASARRVIQDDTTQCLAEFHGVPGAENGGIVQCNDCDPSCDADGVATANNSCTFDVQLCVNQAGGTCTAADLKTFKVKRTGKCHLGALKPKPSGTNQVCGPTEAIKVDVGKKGKPGKCIIEVIAKSGDKPPRLDANKLTLVCKPQPASTCPAPSTTTTLATSTTTTEQPTTTSSTSTSTSEATSSTTSTTATTATTATTTSTTATTEPATTSTTTSTTTPTTESTTSTTTATTTSTTETTVETTTSTTATTETTTSTTTTSTTSAPTTTSTTSTTATTEPTTSSTTETTTTSTTATTESTTTSTTETTTTSTTATTATTTTSTTATTTTTLCSCCPGPNSLIRFTNGIGSGNCGTVSDATNALLFNLACGGLYTGAGASTLTNPAAPPDMGTEYIKPSACSGDTYTILPTVPADLGGVGGDHRNCTSAGVADPDYPACVGGTNIGKPCVPANDCPGGSCVAGTCSGGGRNGLACDCPSSTCTSTMPGCLFGAPLAIPNPSFSGASVCVVNRVQTSASGNGNCTTGSTNLNLPLSSDLYLTGDLLDGSAPDRPIVAGINPCPICDPGTLTCKGGPRHGLACTPDTSVLSAAYPTSHDCPPPPGPLSGNYIGALPIPFNLSTGNQTSTANNTGLAGQEVFCGFCGSQFGPTFHNPPVTCATDAACAGVTGCPGATACNRCKQRDSGAFGPSVSPAPGSEHVISITGSSAGVCLADGAPHAATLVSAFCIPPAYNPTVDANGDLPGPGAVSLPGETTLIP